VIRVGGCDLAVRGFPLSPIDEVLAPLGKLKRDGARVFWFVRGDYLEPFRERIEQLGHKLTDD